MRVSDCTKLSPGNASEDQAYLKSLSWHCILNCDTECGLTITVLCQNAARSTSQDFSDLGFDAVGFDYDVLSNM